MLYPIPGRFGRATAEKRFLWASVYTDVLTILGSTGIILPIGDTLEEASDLTTVTSMGEEADVWTYNPGARSAWGSASVSYVGPAKIPAQVFNGTNEYIETPDDTYYSRGNGTTDSVFSVGAWVNLTDATSSTILARWGASAEEWLFYLEGSDFLALVLHDDSVSKNATRTSSAAIGQSAWRLLIATYDGGGGATAANGIVLYNNGAVEASAAINEATYVAMENLTGTTQCGASAGATLVDGSMAGGPLGPFYTQKQLSADEIKQLYVVGRRCLNV